jgi:6-phosphofructokinase
MGGHKRIGILTSGGDCAGLNPVIRAVVQRAVGTYGWEVLGIRQATLGLMAKDGEFLVNRGRHDARYHEYRESVFLSNAGRDIARSL